MLFLRHSYFTVRVSALWLATLALSVFKLMLHHMDTLSRPRHNQTMARDLAAERHLVYTARSLTRYHGQRHDSGHRPLSLVKYVEKFPLSPITALC